MTTILDIPAPPSVNALFANVPGKGRVKTRAYRVWLDEAGWMLRAARPQPVRGPYEIHILIPRTRGDLTNYEKAVSDLLVKHGVVDDDRHCHKATLEWGVGLKMARVKVSPVRSGDTGDRCVMDIQGKDFSPPRMVEQAVENSGVQTMQNDTEDNWETLADAASRVIEKLAETIRKEAAE